MLLDSFNHCSIYGQEFATNLSMDLASSSLMRTCTLIWWSERICAIRYSAFLLIITEMTFYASNFRFFNHLLNLPFPFRNSSR